MNRPRPTKQSIIDRLINKPGLRARINANCVSCIYVQAAPGSWRKQVTQCTVDSCPLFDIRPVSFSAKDSTGSKPLESGQRGEIRPQKLGILA